jgi:hypothetical protein
MQQVDEYVLKAFFVDSTPQDVIQIINSEVHYDFVAAKGYCEVLLDGGLGDLSARQRDKIEKVLLSLERIQAFFQAALDVESERRTWYMTLAEPVLDQREVA